MKVSESFEMYLRRHIFEPNSVSIKSRAVNLFKTLFGDIDMNEVTEDMAEEYKAALVNQFKLKKSTPNIYLSNIKPFFGWALKPSPFDNVKKFKLAEQDRPIFTPEDIKKVFGIATLREKVVFTLVLSGLRRGELLNVLVDDVEIEQNNIRITHKQTTDRTWGWGTKGKCERNVGIPEWGMKHIVDLIIELRGSQPYLVLSPEHYSLMLKRIRNEKLGFLPRLTKNSCDVPWPGFNRDFNKLLKRAGVEHKRPHDGRATLCMAMLESGEQIPVVSQALGHKSFWVTMKAYTRYQQRDSAKRAGVILSEVMGQI